MRLGGGSLSAYTVLSLLVLILLVVAYCASYPMLRPATFFLPAIAYFFAGRSYAVYLVALIPPAVVGAVTLDSPGVWLTRVGSEGASVGSSGPPSPIWAAWARSRDWAIATAGVGLLCVVCFIFVLASKQPLSLRVTGVATSPPNNLVEAMTVLVTNRLSSTVTPAFTLQTDRTTS